MLGLTVCMFLGSGATARSEELVFGMSAAFSGPTRGLGIEYYRGVMAYLTHINESGGVNGRTIAIKPYDDGYQPLPCVDNTIRLVEKDKVFALFCYVGTPTTARILPLLKKYEKKRMFLLFPFTGAEPLRSPPYEKYVYNLRASYFEETKGLVDHLVAVGRSRIAVFYQQDAYGRNGWDGVRQALDVYGLEMVSEAAYQRGASFDTDFSREVEILRQGKPDAVITVGSYAACAAFVRDARDMGFNEPIASVSFSDSDNILNLLLAESRLREKDYTFGLVNSQVVPSYEDTALEGVRLYRTLMDRYTDMPPEEVMDEPYTPHRYSFTSFEGFLNAMLLVEMVKRMGDDPQPSRIPEAMRSIDGFDLGIGVSVSFGQGSNQGLGMVYYTTVKDGRLVPIRDWWEWAP